MGKRVLVIEDEPNIVEALSFLLSRDGFTVHTHQDGATAMDKLRASPPDLVILDVMLPGRSGFDILTDIRGFDPTRETPVLMLTARGQAQDRERALDLGATEFIAKPFANGDVQALVAQLLT